MSIVKIIKIFYAVLGVGSVCLQASELVKECYSSSKCSYTIYSFPMDSIPYRIACMMMK
jgi:hypothetical protein